MPSNIDDVIDDIDDVESDLRHNLEQQLTSALRRLQADMRTFVERDADWTGALARSMDTDVTAGMTTVKGEVTVGGRPGVWPAIVEFGSGSRTDVPSPYSTSFGVDQLSFDKPADYPYGAPTMTPGFVSAIVDWTVSKLGKDPGVGYAIASSLANNGAYAHPYIRPAWMLNEQNVKRSIRTAVRRAAD